MKRKIIKKMKFSSTDPMANVVLSGSEVGVVVRFTDRSIVIKDTDASVICKRCVFLDKNRADAKCDKYRCCFANIRKDGHSVCFIDEDDERERMENRRVKERNEYRIKKEKGL